MFLKLLGTAAGGGVPQWNCACTLCTLCRTEPERIHPRLQTQAAVSSDGERWFLINASPDLRLQIESTPELCPTPRRGQRNTPIAGIVLTSADLDQVLGLLLLREFQPLTIYATSLVRRVLQANSFFSMLTRVPNQLTWVDVVPETPFSLDRITCTPLPLAGSLPHYANDFSDQTPGEASLGLIFDTPNTRIAYTPSVPEITPQLLTVYETSDVIFVDGTFWTNAELTRTHAGTPLARAIGHVPISGDDGTIALLSGITRPRKYYIHINNTNPILDPQSLEAEFVRKNGWELGHDGWQLS